MTTKDDELNLLVFSLFPDSILQTAGISEEPEIQLYDWDIKMDTTGASYFVGSRVDNGDGRVSTAIVAFDSENRRGRTLSGRVYELLGSRGWSSNGEYVWSHYKVAKGITEVKK